MINENDLEFLQAVWNRRPYYTYLFFGINIAIFLLMMLAGGATNGSTLLAFGVKANFLINQGEYWRFVTPIFIHIGLLHLVFNSYALWIVGPQVEKLYGGARFVLLYLLTGVAGVVGSYMYHPDVPSAGASGAIFGLFGVLLVFGLRYRHNIPPFFRKAVGTGVLPVIIINLVISYAIPQIDMSAHVGGLLAGMALAAVVPFERPRTQTPQFFTAIQMALLLAVVLSFYEVARHYDGPPVSVRNVFRGWGALIGLGSSDDIGQALAVGESEFQTSARVILARNSDVTKPAQNLKAALDRLKGVTSIGDGDRFVDQLVALLQDQYDLMQDVQRAGTVTLIHTQRVTENISKYNIWHVAFANWIRTEGEANGIRLLKPN